MPSVKTENVSLKTASENLVNYAVNRDDLKLILASLPGEAKTILVKIEYELQILKIVSVGWAISFCMETDPNKDKLSETFWVSINEFSKSLSEVTGLMIGKDLDYFQILKERLDEYVKALELSQNIEEPATVIGPAFAGFCGDETNVFAILAGSKIFLAAINAVREYLKSVEIQVE